jgi:hypothetical protein
MFTYLKLKNFKTYKDITINFQNKKDDFKQVIAIYGANGSGKSTIVQAFLTLEKTMGTMQVKDLLMDLLNNKITPPDDIPIKQDLMLEFIKSRLANSTVEKIIDEYKMINSNAPMVLEYGFLINESSGSYFMEFDNSNLIRERLEYKILKNKGCCFNIEEDKVEINSNIFESHEFLEEIKKQIQMYWGKHSFLSILQHEMEEKSAAYINSNISKNLMNVLTAFNSISYKVASNREDGSILASSILTNLEGGVIEKSEEKSLDKVEKVLNSFFVTLFDDVNKAFYHRDEKNGKIRYSLFFNKRIEECNFDIDFRYESSGTQEILDLLPYLMVAITGKCVIIDEFGNGIHDLLAAKLIKAIAKNIKGQLIITTHNTLIMDHSDIKPDALYFIFTEVSGKKVKCVTDIEERLHPNYNYRNRYFNNELYADGLPKNLDVDFSEFSKLYV